MQKKTAILLLKLHKSLKLATPCSIPDMGLLHDVAIRDG